MRRKLVLLMVVFFIMTPTSLLVRAETFDLSIHEGDYVLTENLTISEDSVAVFTEEKLSQLADEELMTLLDSVIADIIANSQVAIARNLAEDPNVYFITIQDDYLVKHELWVDMNLYSNFYYYNQNVAYNDRVAKFEHLLSYMTQLTSDDEDTRHFYSFHNGDIYELFLPEMVAARYEPLTAFRNIRNMTLEDLKLPTDEEYSLLAYAINTDDYESITYNEFSTLEEYGPEFVSLSGEITAYNDSYMDYKEAEMLVEDNGQPQQMILRFYYLPLEPLEIGNKVDVYGQKSNNVNVLSENYDWLSMIVHWIEENE